MEYTEPHFDRAALVTIDLQNDFCLPGAPLETQGGMQAATETAALVSRFRLEGKPILHVLRLYLSDGSNVDACRRAFVQQGNSVLAPYSEGSRLVPGIMPSDSRLDPELLLQGVIQQLGYLEFAMYKPRWGAFYATGLEDFLNSMGVDTIVLTGTFFPNCIRATVYEGTSRDFRIVLARDAIAGATEQGLSEMKRIGCTVLTNSEILRAVSPPPVTFQ